MIAIKIIIALSIALWLFAPIGSVRRLIKAMLGIKPKQAAPAPVYVARKSHAQIERERKALERAEKAEREREQAADDIAFYNEQLAIIRDMLRDAESRLNKADADLTRAKDINSIAPTAISIKEMSRLQRERDAAATKVLTLQNKVHSLDIKRGKAYYKLG